MISSIFVSLIIMCALNGILAFIMILSDIFINDYGEVSIIINNEKNLKVTGGKNLLSTLKDEKLFIPSACGGRGSCGLCKVKVLDGAPEYLPTETPFLNDSEMKNNVRLSCQIKVKNDLKIEIPDELLSVRQFKTEVISIKDLTHDIKELTLQFSNDETFDFKAGQFVQIEVPPYEKSEEPVYRAYSIASNPEIKNQIQLEIRYVPEGICTTYVHQHLKINDTLTINGPYGDFFLRDNDREIIMIAGGSGMAPIRSILFQMKNHQIDRKTWYFFGARSKKDPFLTEEMKEFEQTLPSFKFIPALSAPDSDDHFDGETGLITEVVDRIIQTGKDYEAYLCGSPFMIDACIKVLKNKNIPEELIFYDKFQ